MSPPADGTPPLGLPRYCPSCGRSLEESDVFCPFCGRPLAFPMGLTNGQGQAYRPTSTMETVRRLGRGVTLLALATLLILLLVNVIILIWSPTIVLPEAADPVHGSSLYLIVPWSDPLVMLLELNGVSFGLYHILLVVVITASFVWMVVRSYGTLREELTLERPKEGHSPFWTVGTVFFAVLSINFIITMILLIAGYNPTAPASFEDRPLWALLDGYASASVWEELVTRVLYIGLPLLLIDLVLRRKKAIRRYLLGGGFELGGKELALIWASAGIFALAHTVFWDAWKIVPTWIGGLAFGYLFLRLGLYAAIMLHFAVDYLSIPIELTGDALVVTLVLGLLILFWDVVGGVYIVVFANRIFRFLAGKDLGARRPALAPSTTVATGPERPLQSQKPPPEPQGIGPPANVAGPPLRSHKDGFYSCVKCGNTKARLNDGKLECTRCGNKE